LYSPPLINVIESRTMIPRMRWTCSMNGEARYTYKILAEKLQYKRSTRGSEEVKKVSYKWDL